MNRYILGVAMIAGLAASASAQFPPGYGGYGGYGQPGYGGGYGGYGYGGAGGYPSTNGPFMTNIYNRTNQPLSPYLNLFRGGNPAVNYFYGVRPGTQGGAFGSNNFQTPFIGGSQLRSGFVPAAAYPNQDPPEEMPKTGQDLEYIPSSAHPVVFGNKFGPAAGGYPGTAGYAGPGGGYRPGGFYNRNQGTGTRAPTGNIPRSR